MLRALRMPIDTDPASNLYTGIVNATNGLSLESATPDALEAVAFLMRAKAQLLRKDASKIKKNDPSLFSNEYVDNQSDDMVNEPPVEQKAQSVDDHQDAPEDWLKPKIFTTRNN